MRGIRSLRWKSEARAGPTGGKVWALGRYKGMGSARAFRRETISPVETTCLFGLWPHRFAVIWSSMWHAAAPAACGASGGRAGSCHKAAQNLWRGPLVLRGRQARLHVLDRPGDGEAVPEAGVDVHEERRRAVSGDAADVLR